MKTIISAIHNQRFLRFLLVGTMNTAFGYSAFATLLYLGLHYSLATLVSTILGVIFNFNTIGRLVFKHHDHRLIFRFVGGYGIIYLLNVTSLRICNHFGLNLYLCGFLLILPLALISYTLQSRFVFVGRPPHAE